MAHSSMPTPVSRSSVIAARALRRSFLPPRPPVYLRSVLFRAFSGECIACGGQFGVHRHRQTVPVLVVGQHEHDVGALWSGIRVVRRWGDRGDERAQPQFLPRVETLCHGRLLPLSPHVCGGTTITARGSNAVDPRTAWSPGCRLADQRIHGVCLTRTSFMIRPETFQSWTYRLPSLSQ